mgnify:CR=1 FL=1
MDPNCIFCKIIKGEIPSSTVYEDDDFKAILDISPANKGHVIVLTKGHYANIFELDETIAGKLLPVVKKIASAVKKVTNCDGINILQNNGVAAGQTVFHVHVHIIPRFDNDNELLTWEKKSYEDGEAIQLANQITAQIQ